MEEVNISLKYNVRQSLIELYGKKEVDENWEMVEDAMEHMLIFSNKLPIHNVSKRAFKIDDLVMYEEEKWRVTETGNEWATIESINGVSIAVVDTCNITHVC